MFDQLLAGLARSLDKAQIPYMVIGGQAVLVHGLVRVTDDVDLTLGVDSSECVKVLAVLTESGLEPRVANPQRFVERTMILPAIDKQHNVRVDFAFSFSPYEKQAIQRAVVRKRHGYPVRFATAEDLIVHKLFAGRPQDVQDVKGIVLRQGGKLDRKYLRKWIREFSKTARKGHLPRQLEDLLAET